MWFYLRSFYVVLWCLNALGVYGVSALPERINGTWCTQSDGRSFLLRESSKMGDFEDFSASQLCVTFSVVQSALDSGIGKSYEKFTIQNLKSNPKLSGHFEEGALYDPSLFSYFTTPSGAVEVHVVDVADKSHYQLYLTKVLDSSGSEDCLRGVVFEHGDSRANKREGLTGNVFLVKKENLQPSFDQDWEKFDAAAHS